MKSIRSISVNKLQAGDVTQFGTVYEVERIDSFSAKIYFVGEEPVQASYSLQLVCLVDR